VCRSLADNVSIRKSTAKSKTVTTGDALEQRLHRIVQVLAEHATVVVSGTKMSAELGASRSAVWRMVQQLRGYGVNIEGHPTTGYALKHMPDFGSREILGPLIAGTIFYNKIHHSFRTDSTNAQAMAAGAAGAEHGSVFLAEEQTAGRGRGGHSWLSEKAAGIYCSVLLRPSLAPADMLPLTLAAGLAAQQAVQEITGLKAELRWPNDLLLGSKKFCGILAEMNAEPTRVRYVALGIGMNVNHLEFPKELRSEATSLLLEMSEQTAALARVPLIAALLKSLDCEYRALIAGKPVISRFSERSSYARGKRVRVEEQGEFEGVTAGLDERGFLRVKTASGMRTVISGGVRAI
jgi:BirA family biotin operon repressor/biotin-[acetyl-CoA-carboxylase] ligase